MKKEEGEYSDISAYMTLDDEKTQLSQYLTRISRFKNYSSTLAIIVVGLGVLAVLGWFLNIPILRGEFSGYMGTKLNTAFLFILAGLSLYLLNHNPKSKEITLIRILTSIIIIVGALSLIEYVTGINIGLSQIFSNLLPGQHNVLTKSRILSSINFLMIGMALLMASYKYKIRWIQIMAFICGFVALLGLSAYFYGRSDDYIIDLVVQMALLSSIIHICLSVGILCLFPDKKYMGRITSQNMGGLMARRMLPGNVGAVLIVGLFITLGNRLFFYSTQFHDVLTIVITIAFLTAVIIWNANLLNKIDQQRQKSNEERFKLKMFYENLVEGINEGIWVSDKHDRIYFMNRGMEDITGVETEKMGILDILRDFPDSKNSKLKEYYLKAKKTLKPVHYDSVLFNSPTGKKSYQSGWIIPQLNDGHFNGAICTVIDQTKRREAEKALSRSESHYRTIFENTGTATIIVGVDGRINMANKKSEQLTGYRVDEIEKKFTWMDFTHPDDLEMMKKYHQMRKDQDKDVPGEYEFRLLDKDKNEKQVMLFASLIPGTFDSVVSLLDITERKKSEIAIKKSLKEKELLLREIHHRVKNNMQIISSLLNLQRNYIEDEEANNLLQGSQGRVKSMALVHEKLYQTDDLARINVAEYLRSLTMSIFRSYSVKPDIELRLDVGDVFFNIDTAVPLGLIINELVTNSLKYAFPNNETGKIFISLNKESSEEKYLLIVGDDGIGFPENLNFHETHSLGLQLVNTLVNQLDGSIELVKSKGTCFNIIIKQHRYKNRINES